MAAVAAPHVHHDSVILQAGGRGRPHAAWAQAVRGQGADLQHTHTRIKDVLIKIRVIEDKAWQIFINTVYYRTLVGLFAQTHLFKEAKSNMWEATKSICILLQHLSIDGFTTNSLEQQIN